jgi:general L-amino acid transport system permease protein
VASEQRQAERAAARPPAHQRPPFWRDVRVLRVVIQAAFVVAVVALLWWLYRNLVTNLERAGIRTDFGFLDQPSGFTLLGAERGLVDFSSRDPIWKAIVVGTYNTLRVSILGIVLATILGVIIGVARLSTNWLVRKIAGAFVEALRNVPLLVLIVFMYLAVLQALPRISDAIEVPNLLVLSNRGLYVPWVVVAEGSGLFLAVCALGLGLAAAVGWWRTRRFDATGQPHHRMLWGVGVFVAMAATAWLLLDRPVSLTLPVLDERLVEGGYEMTLEYGALLFALVIYTAAFIAEIVRGSILAVPKGQTEAANALGLRAFQRLRYVILPQALRVAIPPTGNEYINLAKNSALGLAIAFPELLRVTRIAIGQGNPAPQLVAVMMVTYLALSLILSVGVNLVNRRLALRGAR